MNITIQPGDYAFDASAQTIAFANYNPVLLENIRLVFNLVTGEMLFNFAKFPDLGGVVSTDTLTLVFDTTAMADSDELMIVYDDPDYVQEVSISSSSLPTGAATSANQTTIIGHVDGIETLLGTSNSNTGSIVTSVQL